MTLKEVLLMIEEEEYIAIYTRDEENIFEWQRGMVSQLLTYLEEEQLNLQVLPLRVSEVDEFEIYLK